VFGCCRKSTTTLLAVECPLLPRKVTSQQAISSFNEQKTQTQANIRATRPMPTRKVLSCTSLMVSPPVVRNYFLRINFKRKQRAVKHDWVRPKIYFTTYFFIFSSRWPRHGQLLTIFFSRKVQSNRFVGIPSWWMQAKFLTSFSKQTGLTLACFACASSLKTFGVGR